MSRIFISYRRDETAAWAFMVNERLAARFSADKIFMDIDSIEPGDDFVEVIKNKVGACEVLIGTYSRGRLPGKAGFRWDHVSPDGRLTTAAQEITAEDLTYTAIVVKQISGGATIFELHVDGTEVNDWKFSRDGRVLAAAYTNNVVRIWRLEDGECIAAIDVPAAPNGVALSPDGRWLAAACEDKLVRVWPLSMPAPSA
jgi:WD40 repeat protein